LINIPQLVDHFLPGLVTFGSGGVAGPARQADRHSHDVLDATVDTAVSSSLDRCTAYMAASPRPACSDFT
jgi:hypothetical protein